MYALRAAHRAYDLCALDWLKKKSVTVFLHFMQDLVIRRIDEGLGLILEVPSEPATTPGFVHISNVKDAKVDKLQRVLRVTSHALLPVTAFNCHAYVFREAVNSPSRLVF